MARKLSIHVLVLNIKTYRGDTQLDELIIDGNLLHHLLIWLNGYYS